jgi:hypothetical protein
MTGREKDDGAIRFDLPTEWTASSPKPQTSQIQKSAPPKMSDIQSLQGKSPVSHTPNVGHGKTRMPRISIRVPAEILNALDAEALERCCSISEIVRELLHSELSDTKDTQKMSDK